MKIVASLQGGARVKVTQPITVHHVGKFKSGLNLQGMSGKVIGDVRQYEGKELSANLPWKVEFEVENEGGTVKVVAHLNEDEIEVV